MFGAHEDHLKSIKDSFFFITIEKFFSEVVCSVKNGAEGPNCYRLILFFDRINSVLYDRKDELLHFLNNIIDVLRVDFFNEKSSDEVEAFGKEFSYV